MGVQMSKRSNYRHTVLQNHDIGTSTVENGVAMPSTTAVAAAASTSTSRAANDIHYRAELSSYEAECRVDPMVQTFDTTLQQRMSRAISSLAVGVEVRALSLDSLKEITTCLLDMNQEVVKIILDCKKDIWKNPELFNIVEDYFENSLQTLDFCTVLEKCLNKARDAQLIVHVALQRFEEEEDGEECHNKYLRTLEELKSFKAAGDPFTNEFFREFQSVYGQQLAMLEKLQLKKNKLDKKLKSVKAWRKVSSIIFVSAFMALLICSVVAAAIAAPPVASALAAAASLPVGSMGKWIDFLWKGYENALRGQREIIHSMQVGSYIAVKDLDSIGVLVDQLEIQIDLMLHNVEFALQGEVEVKLVVEEIKKKLALFMKNIDELGKQADKCSRDIRRARTVVLQRIIKNPR